MLDYVLAFERGGAILWALQFTSLRHNPLEAINALIRGCLLEERLGENTFTFNPKSGAPQTLKWTFHNGLGLVFVAVYQKTLSLLYVDELLSNVKEEFVNVYKPGQRGYRQFDETFNRLLRDAESRADAAKKQPVMRSGPPANAKQTGSQAVGAQAKKGAQAGKDSGDDDASAARKGAANGAVGNTSDGSAGGEDGDNSGGEDNVRAFDVSKLPKGMAGRGARGVRGRPVPGGAKVPDSGKKKEDAPAPKVKKARNWNTLLSSGKGDTPTRIDYTEDGDGPHTASDMDLVSGASASATEDEGRGVGVSRMDVEEDEYDDSEFEEDEELNNGAGRAGSGAGASGSAAAAPKKQGLLASFVNSLAMNVVGKAALSRADVEPALAEMKRKLMERNVAEEIAAQVCDSVGRNLEGQRLAGFTGVAAFVRNAFEEALSGILNKRSVDVLLDIKKSQARGKPYVIVFCGVNGVGKSTNLAKIAYWLGSHNIKVMIAACDTFRAGAVEQLKTHCARLRVPLYERGYEKDPAKVAYEAVRQAEKDGIHVVLVDTAGRMQDNQPLMRALSNLISLNNPNLVLFVGEALVGNDAVDQLTKFNKSLSDLAPTTAAGGGGGAGEGTGAVGRGQADGSALTRRHGGVIDGIVLTKFDTIDEKVGAALSMVYTSGAPVMFVGCGQTYVDLKKLNVKSVVKSLLK
ncbi:hypothetical protein HYH02_003915 [Chlamydomonas schloesseri]|uniref:SRP54-type proteins GTP-binding domain-containing protein n=1 Tax=Chlamydomonas schloesseri TaxID=2026947 RepID=A0A835WQ19_9CHLO|nr:hypothetical protein HYH02_003915 [Chlamydomonas schloesseri]|eukprot:KAG2451309.1 hypothetical protein HYH02_003915 [Chlamydomonas schloesseri]